MIPLQLPSSAEESVEMAADSAVTFTSVTLVGNFFLNTLLSLSIQELISALNTMQLLTHVNLMNVKQPANSNRFLLYFIKLCTFELIPTDGLMDYFDFPDTGALNINFQDTGYESIYAVSNLGLVYFIIHAYFVVSLLNLILYVFSGKFKHVNTLHQKINSSLYWNGYMLLIFETFFDLIMVILVNMKIADWDDE